MVECDVCVLRQGLSAKDACSARRFSLFVFAVNFLFVTHSRTREASYEASAGTQLQFSCQFVAASSLATTSLLFSAFISRNNILLLGLAVSSLDEE
jgi:hypothetical protein